ncbi:MAG: ABC transporter permease [Granulosicoccus sp.]|nr:ABC transporter permease [Granulosicoccus sp.]
MSAGHILQRLLLVIPTLFGVAVVVFVLLRVVPGNPIAMMTPPGASAADIEQLKALYGFDKSIVEQFTLWLSGLLQGDLGTSISLRQSVVELILGRLPATLELCLLASLMATILCLMFSMAGSYRPRGIVSRFVDLLVSIMQAVPDFLWALLLILMLGVAWPWFPISGRINPRLDYDFSTQFYLLESILRLDGGMVLHLMHHLFLPTLALALPMAGIVTRLLKTSLVDTLQQEYITMARARGFSRWHVLSKEALRNATIPTLALGGVQLTFLIGGTVLVERIFGYPGIGNMAISAVIQRDLPLIQGLVLTFAALFIIINLLVDLLYAKLNPRLRSGG